MNNLDKKFSRYMISDKVIFSEGDMCTDTYILLDGEVEIIKNDEIIAIIKEKGTFIGEMGALLNIPRTATCKTRTECQFLVIKPSDFEKIISTNPGIGHKLSKVLAERLLMTTTKLMTILSYLGEKKEISLEAIEQTVFSEHETEIQINNKLKENAKLILAEKNLPETNELIRTEDLITEGNIFYSNRQFQRAIDIFEKVIKAEPDNLEIKSRLANSYFYFNNFEKAIEIMEECLKEKPENIKFHNNLALYYFKNKNMQKALKQWEKVISLDPKNIKALNNLRKLKENS